MQFKISLWEEVSVWQEVTVVVEASSKKDLEQKIKEQRLSPVEWYDANPDWNTEEHLGWDPVLENYRILEESN